MQLRHTLLFILSPFLLFAQENTFYPSDSMILHDRFEYRMDLLSDRIDQMDNLDSLYHLESKLARLYWGTSANRIILSDTTLIDGYCDRYGSATHHYMYLDMNGEKIPDALMCTSNVYQYYLFDYSNIGALPNLPPGNVTRYVYMRYSPDVPDVIPSNWAIHGDYIQRLYFQRCGYSTAQVDALIIQLESLVNQGMGTSLTGVHYMYLNGTGANQNETLTLSTHTDNGWTSNSTYISKTINGTSWRVYHN